MTQNLTTLDALLDHLAGAPDGALIFALDGVEIKPGYHVTEVKHSPIRSVDCGGKTDQWDETVIQLLDGGGKGEHMSAEKFTTILSRANKVLPGIGSGELFIEFAPDNGSAQKLRVAGADTGPDRTVVQLGAINAACKPFVRAQAAILGESAKPASGSGCCGGSTEKAATASPCCA